nr:gamma-secretase subunit PEN-2-like isoform X2 [Anolis sagrei ordinatus]
MHYYCDLAVWKGPQWLQRQSLRFARLRGEAAGGAMNLERVSNEEKLSLCQKYYLGGFALLPFLWLVNVFWFFREAFLAPAYTEQLQIKHYVQRSAVGLLFWVIVLTTWISIFQARRAGWGELGDYLSFTIPLGTP